MLDGWNPEIYRARAQQWLEKAEKLPEGDERKACLVIAEGYSKLVALIEKDQPVENSELPACIVTARKPRLWIPRTSKPKRGKELAE